jgi:hypothetical protein
MRTAYGLPQGFASFGEVAVLAAGYLKYLDSIAVPPRVLALAQLQFSAPAIIRQRCAHEVAELQHEAEQAASSGDSAQSVELWTSCVSLEPDDPALLIQERRALLNQGLADKAHAVEAEILAHPKLSQPQRAQLLSELGDAAWRADDTALAAQHYAEAAALPQPEAQSRALEARQYAMAERGRWTATRRLLAGNDAGAETWLLLRDLDVARPQEGFAAYLLAKQAQNISAWDSCLRFSASALTRELPGPLFVTEALRMRALCGWRGGDDAAARRALEHLARDPSEARHIEATRMLRRTP